MKQLIALLLLAVQCESSYALDLKGVRIGMSRDELAQAFLNAAKPMRPEPGEISCASSGSFCSVNVGTLAGVPITLHVIFLDNKIAHVYAGNFHPSHFEQLADALKTKYGQPTITNMGEVQNQMGGKFDNPSYVWKFPEGELRASKHMPGAPTLDVAQIEIDSAEWIARENEKRAKENSDL